MHVGCYTNIHFDVKQVAAVCGDCSRTQIMFSKMMPEGCGYLYLSHSLTLAGPSMDAEHP